MVPFVALGASIWGAAGVLIGQMAGGALVALVALWLARRVMAHAETSPTQGSESPDFQTHRRAFTMLHHRR